jgi:hypothetical protein
MAATAAPDGTVVVVDGALSRVYARSPVARSSPSPSPPTIFFASSL